MNENNTLRDRLRELGIKIIDLARILDISRPTLYKYIESYEMGELDNIDSSYIALFHYITQNEYINAKNVFIYITQNILSLKEKDSQGKRVITGNAHKDAFITILLESHCFDDVLGYFISCYELLQKDTLSDESKAFLQPLLKLYESLGLKLNILQGESDGKQSNTTK
ncbi:helix-turn-helix domain-containing protein [uncultured Helicobacter sp.]|uniref:helix-turn-helix domain-containing protein n=1 Tax=uncultured Helicobacter sp. TaxID=175537 RepID=UPI00374F95D7